MHNSLYTCLYNSLYSLYLPLSLYTCLYNSLYLPLSLYTCLYNKTSLCTCVYNKIVLCKIRVHYAHLISCMCSIQCIIHQNACIIHRNACIIQNACMHNSLCNRTCIIQCVMHRIVLQCGLHVRRSLKRRTAFEPI